MNDLHNADLPPEATPDPLLAQARQRLAAGKIAAAAGDFATAGAELQQALALLGTAPTETSSAAAQPLRDEVAAMATIVELLEQAETAREQGQYDQALAAVDRAAQQINRADDPALAELIETRRQQIYAERKRVDEEEQLLIKGQRLLAQRVLDKAAECFRAASEASSPDIRRRAEEELKQVLDAIQAFEDDVRQARQTTDARAAADAWQCAHDRWPTERSATSGLTNALTRAGMAVLGEGDAGLARNYFERALQLKPKDPKASDGIKLLARAEQIKDSIDRTRDEIDKLTQRGVPKDGDDLGLREQLTQLASEAAELPALQRELAALVDDLDQRQEYGRAIAIADEQAAQLATAGDWDGAVGVHADALATLGDPPPALAVRRHTAWKAAREASTTAARDGAQLIEAAQEVYAAGRAAADFNEVLAKIALIDQLIDATARRLQIVGVARPSELQLLSNQASTLRRRAEAAALAYDYDAVTTQQGLSSINAALRTLGEDATLRRIETELSAQRSEQVPGLLAQAQQAEELDAIDDALDYLRQAREIDPNNPDLGERLEQINRRRRFEEALRRAEVDAEVAGSSLTATRNALRRALEVFLMPEFAVPDATRATIRALIALGDEDSGEALAAATHWRQARELREKLLNHAGWADRRAAQLADQWLEVAREAALRGAISSLAQIGDVLGAYRTAFNYWRVYQTEESLSYLERAQENLRQSLAAQADKLLGRATDALATGQYAPALDNIEQLERDYYAPIEREFPFLLGNLDEYGEISQSRRDARALRQQAEELRQQAETIKQALDTAESAFVANQFVEAEKALQAITHNPKLEHLKQRADALAQRIERSRKQQARSRLGDQLARARTALRTENDHQQLFTLLADLEQSQIDWDALTSNDRAEFDALAAQVSEAANTLKTIAAWEADARQAYKASDYERAARSLESAISATEVSTAAQVGDLRARLQAEFAEIQALSRRQRSRTDALAEGRRLLGLREYRGAIEAFALAQSFGANVDLLERAARAGALLQSARAAWEAKNGLSAARNQLDFARLLAKDNPEASSIAQEIAYYEPLILEATDAIQLLLANARSALAQNDLLAAGEHINAILSWDTAHPEGLKLQREHQARTKARDDEARFQLLLERAEQERKRGNTRTALTFISDALNVRPDDPLATNLRVDVEREHEANELLRLARNEIYGGKFLHATDLIRQAEIHASAVLLEEVRQLLEELEAAHRANTVYPIRNLMRDGRYGEALRRCVDALKYAESLQLRDELADLEATVVRRWVDTSITQAQSQLRNAAKEEDFADIVKQLVLLGQDLKEIKTYPEHTQLEHQIRQTNIGRLNRRLDTVETILQQRALLYQAGSAEPSEASVDGIAVVGPNTLKDQLPTLASTALQEAEAMQLEQLSTRARTLLRAIDERLVLEQSQEARVLYDRASSRPTVVEAEADLKQAYALIQTVLKHERFQNDTASVQLLDQIDKATRSLKQTRDGLEQAEKALASGSFSNALRALRRIGAVYSLQRPRYDHLVELLELLIQAEALANRLEWREAFRQYRKAALLEPKLELLTREIERCQDQITAQLRQEAQAALRALPPDPDVAQALLVEAEKEGWIDASASREIATLRRWITSRKRAVSAIMLLDPAHAEPERALDMLREAQGQYSDPESDDQLQQWMMLAQALHEWQTGNPSPAFRLIEQITQPVATMLYVRTARRLIHEQLLTELRAQARQALQTWNPEEAVQPITRGTQIAPDDPELRDLIRRQQQILQEAPELRRYMDQGWRALEHVPNTEDIPEDEWEYLVEAQTAFDQALQIDESFAEAAQWLLFTQQVERGLRIAQQREALDASQPLDAVGQVFADAGQLLEAAAQALATSADDPRPRRLYSAKRQNDRRQYAVDRATQLAAAAHELAKLYRNAYAYEQRDDVDNMYPTLLEIDQRQDYFKQLSREPLVVPANRAARRGQNSAAQAPANGAEPNPRAATPEQSRLPE